MEELKKTILVTGATGFIGRRLGALLDPRKFAFRALARDPARARGLLASSVEIVTGDMTDPASLRAALRGAHGVVHMAALKSDEADIAAVNVGGARNLVGACKAEGVRRVVNIGSQAARLKIVGAYGETKGKADAILAASGLDVTTLLPSVVYGPDDPGVFGKLARFVTSFPVVPVMGDGTAAYHPVHVDDLCRGIEGCLNEPKTIGKVYHVGGAETVTLEGLVDLVAGRRGKSPIKIFLPGWLALLLARAIAPLFDSPPLSRSNVLGGIQSAPDADYLGLFNELGVKPRTIEQGMTDSLR